MVSPLPTEGLPCLATVGRLARSPKAAGTLSTESGTRLSAVGSAAWSQRRGASSTFFFHETSLFSCSLKLSFEFFSIWFPFVFMFVKRFLLSRSIVRWMPSSRHKASSRWTSICRRAKPYTSLPAGGMPCKALKSRTSPWSSAMLLVSSRGLATSAASRNDPKRSCIDWLAAVRALPRQLKRT